MIDWRPTHVAPAGGLSMWAAPDPSQAAVAELTEGTPVVVSQRQGAWAEVVCSNGFRAWVDGSRLVAGTEGPPQRVAGSRRPMWIALGLVAVAAVIAGILIASSGGKDKPASSSSSAAASQLIRLHIPTGWSSSADGLTVAENKSDLERDIPTGPRVRATVVATDIAVQDVIGDALAKSSGATIKEGPAEAKVSGVDAATVAIEQNDVVQRLIYVHPQGKDAVVFTLEAPTASFTAAETELASVPGLVT